MKKYCKQCKRTYTGISDSNECPECETPLIPESSEEKEEECVFCNIANRTGEDIIDIEPLNPVVKGHRIVFARQHSDDFTDNIGLTMRVIQRASEIAKELGGDFNLITSKGGYATQSVFHLHIHIIPRKQNDGLKLPWTNQLKSSTPPTNSNWEEEFIEKGADIEHERWSHWQKYMHSKILPSAHDEIMEIGTSLIEHWNRQINTSYSNLSEKEKESDRNQVRKYLPLISSLIQSEREKEKEEQKARLVEEIKGIILKPPYEEDKFNKISENEPLSIKHIQNAKMTLENNNHAEYRARFNDAIDKVLEIINKQ